MKGAAGALVTRYARSLFAAARERGALNEVRRDTQAFYELWAEQPELKALLLNPGLSCKKLRNILTAIADKLALNQISRAFIDVLLDKDRLEILADVHPVFERLMFVHEGKIAVKVTTAIPLSGGLQQQIEQHLKRHSGKDPVVEWRENPAIIGGVVVEWPDRIYDGSLARKIQNMKLQLAETA